MVQQKRTISNMDYLISEKVFGIPGALDFIWLVYYNVHSLCVLIRKFPLTKYVVKPFLEKALALRKPHYQKSQNVSKPQKILGQSQKINFELAKSQIIEQMFCLKMRILNSFSHPISLDF